MKRNKKGFTLAELLIVVAIIAVLVAVSIPVFTAQLAKAQEATDVANIRAAYASAAADAVMNASTGTKDSVAMVHEGAFSYMGDTKIGDKALSSVSVTKGHTVTVSVDSSGSVTITPN